MLLFSFVFLCFPLKTCVNSPSRYEKSCERKFAGFFLFFRKKSYLCGVHLFLIWHNDEKSRSLVGNSLTVDDVL